jgi:hypothetical protein
MMWNRRDFAKLGAMGLAARYATMMDAEAPRKKTGYAVIGLGRIAGHFIPGARLTTNSQITGLVSGHPDKAALHRSGVRHREAVDLQLRKLRRDCAQPDDRCGLRSVTNSMHAEYTIRAAKAGKHVLCETPMATQRGRGTSHDCCLQGRECEVDDCLSLPLRANQFEGGQADS